MILLAHWIARFSAGELLLSSPNYEVRYFGRQAEVLELDRIPTALYLK